MTTADRLPDIVIVPNEHLDDLVNTLESIVAVAPTACLHLARTDIPAFAPATALAVEGGLDVIDASARDGWDAMVRALDRRFRRQAWCLVIAGERLDPEAIAVLGAGGQIFAIDSFPWLEVPSPTSGPRVRADGRPIDVEPGAILPPPELSSAWTAVLGRAVHASFRSFEDVYEDVCTLTHLGQLDAAYQRAELSWRDATGESRLRLVRSAVVLASMLGLTGSALQAAAEWFRLEPHPYVALEYVRAGLGRVPFDLLDRVFALVPRGTPIVYGDCTLMVSLEQVLALRNDLDQRRTSARLALDFLLRSLGAGLDDDSQLAGAIRAASLLGVAPVRVIGKLRDAPRPTAFGDDIDINLELGYLAGTMRAIVDRFGPAPWVQRVAQRAVMARNFDAARAFDAAGIEGLDHWDVLEALEWIDPEAHVGRGRLAMRADDVVDDRFDVLRDLETIVAGGAR